MQKSDADIIVGTPTVKFIPLTRGLWTVVDVEDFEWLNQWSWCVKDAGRLLRYAKRGTKQNKKTTAVYMHRFIVAATSGQRVDHRDRNGLNNTRGNFRVATPGQNMANQRLNLRNSSGFKGVNWNKAAQKWCAKVTCKRKQMYLGLFESPIEAAMVYDAAAIRLFGEFACTNRLLGLLTR